MTSRKKFLDPATIDDAIGEIARRAEEDGVRVALIGGVAMELYGSARMTTDVDFACSGMLCHMVVRHTLSFGGAAVATSKGHPVDLVIRSDVYAPLYAEALEKSVREPGLLVRVVRPEHLAAMKMAAGRDKDKGDLKTLIRLGVVTFAGLASIVEKHLGAYAVQELRNLFREVEWLAARENE